MNATPHVVRTRLAAWLHRVAFRLAGKPGLQKFHEPIYHQRIDTWTYPINFAGQYREMALEGFVGITKLVEMPDGGWTLQIEQLDVARFVEGLR